MHPYATGVVEKINQAISDQMDLLREASIKLADRVEQGGLLYVLGSGHSHMIAEEIFYRAGDRYLFIRFLNPALCFTMGH